MAATTGTCIKCIKYPDQEDKSRPLLQKGDTKRRRLTKAVGNRAPVPFLPAELKSPANSTIYQRDERGNVHFHFQPEPFARGRCHLRLTRTDGRDYRRRLRHWMHRSPGCRWVVTFERLKASQSSCETQIWLQRSVRPYTQKRRLPNKAARWLQTALCRSTPFRRPQTKTALRPQFNNFRPKTVTFPRNLARAPQISSYLAWFTASHNSPINSRFFYRVD